MLKVVDAGRFAPHAVVNQKNTFTRRLAVFWSVSK